MRWDEREVSQGQIINDFTGQIKELSSFPEDYGEPLKCLNRAGTGQLALWKDNSNCYEKNHFSWEHDWWPEDHLGDCVCKEGKK